MTLKEKAIRVVPGLEIEQRLGGVEVVTAEMLQDIVEKNEKSFGTNDGAVAWVENGEYYTMPFTAEILKKLKEKGLQNKSIPVLISGWKRPVNPKLRKIWEEQLKAAQEQ